MPTPASGGRRGSRGPIRGYPPLPGQPYPVYPQNQFSLWNRFSTRAAWLGLSPGEQEPQNDSDPGYTVLAISESSADATSTQTWAAIDDTGGWAASRPDRPRGFSGDHGSYPGQRSPAGRPADPLGPARSDRAAARGSRNAATDSLTADDTASRATRPPGLGGAEDGWRSRSPRDRQRDAAPQSRQAHRRARAGRAAPDAFGASDGAPAGSGKPGREVGARAVAGRARPAGPVAAVAAGQAEAGPAEADGALATRSGGSLARPRPSRTARGGGSGGRHRFLMALLVAPVVVVVLVVAAYVYLSSGRAAKPVHASAPPTAVPSSPAPTLGPWKHIDSRADDPAPLTLAELFPARLSAGARTVEKAGTYCPKAVIGGALRAAVRKASCSQVMRASYLSANRKMMATVGVLNLSTASAAERVGHATGATEFISQLPAAHGPTKDLAKGTGLEEAEVKGHYLILIWAEFADLRAPSGKRQRSELLQFSNTLITDTVNVSLSSRMVTGQPTIP